MNYVLNFLIDNFVYFRICIFDKKVPLKYLIKITLAPWILESEFYALNSISFLNNEEKILDKVVFRWVDEIVATRKTLRY